MRRIAVVLGVVAVMMAIATLTAGVALAQAEIEKFQAREPLTFTDYNPCTGEEILWEGVWTVNIHVTTNARGRHALTRNHTINLIGTGLETGDEYRAAGAGGWSEQQLFTGQLDTYQHVYGETGMSVTISKGDSSNYLGRYRVKTLYDENGGQPNLSFEVLSRDCSANVELQWPEEPVE